MARMRDARRADGAHCRRLGSRETARNATGRWRMARASRVACARVRGICWRMTRVGSCEAMRGVRGEGRGRRVRAGVNFDSN